MSIDVGKFPIALASASPRRIDIMRSHGVEPLVVPADTDEALPEGLNVRQAVMYLALKKALWVENAMFRDACGEPYIVAADTVVYNGRVIGKPADAADAKRILGSLRGAAHYVYTGVAILKAGEKKRKVFHEKTKVFFKNYSEKDLRDYIKSGEPFDKAGGYAIQGGFSPFIDRIEGDLDNVIGFPWKRFTLELAGL
ncbi:MAG: Maf family protein [Clostridiales Family XIII bacterium]|jgi:septum formation protein|nr:Maf family protein [Clostridiales Family XIII bacterium]